MCRRKSMKVLLLENIHTVAAATFEQAGFAAKRLPSALEPEDLAQEIHDAVFIGVRSRTQLTEDLLQQAPLLLAIGAFSIGTNNIALKEAMIRGIPVFNAPYSSARSVAELTVAEIVLLLRNVIDKILKMHQGRWEKNSRGSYETRGKKLGIIGYGNIGSQVGHLAEDLGMEVYYYDIADKLSLGNAKPVDSLDELLAIADVVTVHVDGRPENRNLIGREEFAKMKDGAIFLNLSRGYVVDLEALYDALVSGKLAGAGIDVFPQEPRNSNGAFQTPLQGLPNVILTPHIGGSTEEAQENIGRFVAQKLLDYYRTGTTTLSVNFPNVQLPPVQNAHRLIHIHRNVPGVLSELNAVFARNNVNILSQYLRTNEDIGYVITDVDRDYQPSLLEELHRVKATIRVRVLY